MANSETGKGPASEPAWVCITVVYASLLASQGCITVVYASQEAPESLS